MILVRSVRPPPMPSRSGECRRFWPVIAMLLALFAAGCGADVEVDLEGFQSEGGWQLEGEVVEVRPSSVHRFLLRTTEAGQIWLGITEDTEIGRLEDGTATPIDADDVTVGDRVEVLITGAIADMDPAFGTASTVVVVQ